MSLLDKASLVVTPNAYKESKLYSVIPSDGSGDMTVVRATTATRINSAGLVEVVPRNLLTYSQDLSSGYTLNQCTNTSSQTAFDGTSNARRITNGATATDPYFEQSVSFSPTTYTWSVYVKQGTASTAAIKPVHVGIVGDVSLMTFTFATETISTSGAITTSGFTKLTNGWYRIYCSVNITSAVSSLRGRFGNPNVANVYNDWAYPQLEASSTASEFLPTTTRLNMPRIDYANGSCPSLLIEPQRTNLQLNSEDFSNASWVKTLSAVVANQIASPSGNVDADKLNETATTGNHQLESSRNASIAAYSMSVFAKKAEREWLYLFEDTTGKGAYFNLNNGTIGTIAAGATAKIESFGNGWYRCSVTYNESGTFGRYRIAVTTGNGVTSYTGVANNGIYIWGAQYELGAYSTSYIPTTASSVTRNMDIISKTGISSLIGQTEGTAFIECTADTTNPNGAMLLYLGSSDGSGAFNYSTYLKFSSTSLNLAVYSGGTSYVDSTSSQTYTNKQNIKVAIAYKNNDFVCYANGVQLFIDTTGVVSTNLSTLSLGYYPPNIPYNQYNGNIKSVQLYKTRLTNAELAQLTTL